MTQIIDLTPHGVTVLDPVCCEYDARTSSYRLIGEPIVVRVIEPEGVAIPRCSTHQVECEPIDGIPTWRVEFGEVTNLPEEQPGVYLIVSAIAANAGRANGRTDLLVPVNMVRDASGNIVGCLGLARG